MHNQKTSVRSRLIEWALWRFRVKKMFTNTQGLRERVLKGHPKNIKPPRALYRRFELLQTVQGGQPVFTLRRRKSTASGAVLYLHGGAYVYEMMAMQWKLLGKVLDKADVSITVPIFPLAPDHTVEEILPFVRSTYENLLYQDSKKSIVLLGDSSGGGLCLALAQQLRDSTTPPPKALILISPWLDVTCSDPAQDDLEKLDPILARPGLREEGRWYAGNLSPADTRVSPLFGDLTRLPPMLVLTGTHDLLHADSTRLQKKVARQPGALHLKIYKNMLHVWPTMPIPEAKDALQDIVAFLESTLRYVVA